MAYLSPSGQSLLIRFEDGLALLVSAVHSDVPEKPVALAFEIGYEKDNATFEFLDRSPAQPPQTRALRGMTFTGLDQDVLMFDHRYGAQITPERIRWVKVAKD